LLLSLILLIASLLAILAAAEGFTNAVESLGKRLKLTQAVVGSVLSAVGTALPETILPLVAILMDSKEVSDQIGVGAILGAPFMLSTLTTCLVGITVLITFLLKRRPFSINLEYRSIRRDLTFFVLLYGSAVFLPAMLGSSIKIPLAILLILGYGFYIRLTARAESAGVEHDGNLHVNNLLVKLNIVKGHDNLMWPVMVQGVSTLAIMVGSAQIFVNSIAVVCAHFGFNPMLFALIIAPIATELPEKFNSITWTLKNKDTLAMCNITGAMVFQATFPVSVGLLLTDWQITGLPMLSAIIALTSALIMLAEFNIRKKLSPFTAFFVGLLYVSYIVIVIHVRG